MRLSVARRSVMVALALAVGVIVAFAGVGPSILADGPASERRMVVGLVVLAYGLLGLLFGWLFRSWRGGFWLSIPAMVMVGLLAGDGSVLVPLLYLALVVGAACLGARGGAALYARWRDRW